GELLGRWQHGRQRARGVGDLVDIEEHRTWDVLIGEFRFRIALLRRQIEGAVDDADVGRIEALGQPLGADESVRSCVFHDASYGSAMMKRRFILPLFSILVHSTRPISAVRATCVPPQAWRSTAPTWPPVTLPLMMADMTCSAVCMRMWR